MELHYKTFGLCYRIIKWFLRRNPSSKIKIYYAHSLLDTNNLIESLPQIDTLNGYDSSGFDRQIQKNIYWGDNYYCSSKKLRINKNFVSTSDASFSRAFDAWDFALSNSIIGPGYANSGLCKVCYIENDYEFCLSSWIWTAGKIVDYFLRKKNYDCAQSICKEIIKKQTDNGAWIVRNDIVKDKVIPVLAPNDSAYLANYALLGIYNATKEKSYLECAVKCAEWIMSVTREDGLVETGYNYFDNSLVTSRIIVDTGFTTLLFANLFRITGNMKYYDYCLKFSGSFIKRFFDSSNSWFVTNIDRVSYERFGGAFFRGQGWALEGLIETYLITKNEMIFSIIESVFDMLIKSQMKNGAWAGNLKRKFMGIDSKGVPIIANLMCKWIPYSKHSKELHSCVEKAILWIEAHTILSGIGSGYITSYSFEGAISHSFYKNCGMLYSSAYAVELYDLFGKENET